MAQDFRATIAGLWARLGLGEPRFNEPNRIQLRIDGTSLDLIDNGRGRLVVEGEIAPLPPDRVEASRKTRRVLETNLGFLLGNEAGIYVKRRQDGGAVFAARATYAYNLASVERLVKTVEDTLQVIEYYRAQFSSTSAYRAAPARGGVSDDADQAMIFRP